MADSTGYILTNAHVVEGAADVTVVLDGGIRTFGRVVARDAERDIALVKIDRGQLSALRFATAARIGEDVIALGYPFGTSGLENMTISTGVVSAFQSFDGVNYVQTDAAVNTGNSGGPLLDMAGRVVGMNTRGIRKDIAEGLNFAIHYQVLSERLPILIAEANAPATPTLAGSFGPTDGSIEHDPNDGLIDAYSTGISLADGVVEARFFNPYSPQTGSWSSGFLLRWAPSQPDHNLHAVVVTEQGYWSHILRTGDGEHQRLDSGYSAAIATDEYGSNHVQVIMLGGLGALFVNGEFVASLDLSGLVDAGDVSAVAGYFTADGVEGESTQFEDFKITPIRATPIFGPLDGSIEHDPDDGKIDGYFSGIGVSLADGVIEARFFNPYSPQTGSWSSGFLLRWAPSQPDNKFHAVVVTEQGYWYHILRTGDGEHQRLDDGYSSAITTGAYDSNHVQVIVLAGLGALFVNGEFVASLDLSGLVDAGGVSAVAGYFRGDGVEGESTQFEHFKITLLPEARR